MKAAIPFALVAAMLGASPAWSCRVPIPSAKFRIADVVVDGVATCLKKSGKCSLRISFVRKGNLRRGKALLISVDDAPAPLPTKSDEIYVGACPQTFQPTEAINKGRFYLRKRADGSLYAFVPPDLQETEN